MREIDGVRGLAVAMVVAWHYFFLPWEPVPRSAQAYFRSIFSAGWSGVDLFFVLSGFLIGGILMRERESTNYFSVFYIRRVCRIFPLYFAVLIAFFVARYFLSGEPRFIWLLNGQIPAWTYAAFTQNFAMAHAGDFGASWLSPTWSLAIEEQFYLLTPFVVRFLPPRRLPWVVAGLVFIAPVTRTVIFLGSPGNDVAPFVLLPCRWDALLIGVLGAMVSARADVRAWLAIHSGKFLAALFSFGFAMFLFQLHFRMFSLPMNAAGDTLLAVLYCGLILGAIHTPLGALFRGRFLVWLGGISYCLYLDQQPIQGLLYGILRGGKPQLRNLTDLSVTLLSIGVALVVAHLSGRLFERPFLLLGKRFPYIRNPSR